MVTEVLSNRDYSKSGIVGMRVSKDKELGAVREMEHVWLRLDGNHDGFLLDGYLLGTHVATEVSMRTCR